MRKLEDFVSLSDGKTVSGRFSIDGTETFQGKKIPHRKQDCLDCDSGKNCFNCVVSDWVRKPKLNCFNCEAEIACIPCLDLVSKKKIYSTDNNMLTRKPANEYHQMIPWHEGEYIPKTSTFNFEAAKEIF